MRPLFTLLVALVPATSGCERGSAHASGHAAPQASASHGVGGEHHAPSAPAHPHEGDVAPAKLPVPFIGEPGSLEVAKGFLRTMVTDNESFVSGNPAGHFQPFVATQKPRATVIACADSRVQAHAFDKASENDLFTIRNIGNQLRTTEGSVLYGVEHLATSVLLVLGHTGCGAVKAAMGPHADLATPIRAEVDSIVVPPRKPGVSDLEAWADAVVSNVHDQVKAATAHFAGRVRDGRLIIVGAIYDFRNDLKHGYGRVTIVNVNGTTDAASIAAFTKSVEK